MRLKHSYTRGQHSSDTALSVRGRLSHIYLYFTVLLQPCLFRVASSVQTPKLSAHGRSSDSPATALANLRVWQSSLNESAILRSLSWSSFDA